MAAEDTPPLLAEVEDGGFRRRQNEQDRRGGYATFSSESEQTNRAKEHNIASSNQFRYWAYYLPFLSWMPQYRLAWLRGDCIAALTVASLYIPMCFSFAMLGKVGPESGLYAFIIHPLIYAMLGSCPQMVVGPEATGSLLVGAIVRQVTSHPGHEDLVLNSQISGVATAIAGLMLLAAGVARIGFVDSVLNPAFMQGFISAVGFVLVIEQALPELGLLELAKETGVAHSSAAVKLWFLLTHLNRGHLLTAIVSMSSLGFILVFRAVQKRLQARHPGIKLFPDRLFVVVTAAVLTWLLQLDKQGLEILGSLQRPGSILPSFHWPFQSMAHVDAVLSTSFLIALLGFFESSVTAKSIRPEKQHLQGVSLSANRELVALGTANVLGGCFVTLPAFGGFGRSKLNVQTGGTTPMSSILLSIISLLSVIFLFPYLYYVPKPTLSAMASAVGISMMEECPHNIKFFLRVRGWRELCVMGTVFLATVLYSMPLGVAIGGILTMFQLVQHTTRSRIQVLGRRKGTTDTFEDIEVEPWHDQIEQCLIVRIPEPLTFANSGDLRARLRRLEHYGNNATHPSLPRLRDQDEALIIDAQGLTAIDACGTHVLAQIVQDRVKIGTQIVFCRVRPTQVLESLERGGVVEMCGGPSYFVGSVEEALRLVGVSTQ